MNEVVVQEVKMKQVNEGEILSKLSPSAQEIYMILKAGPYTPKDILERTNISPRTLRYALKKLVGLKLVKKFPNFDDLRQNFYALTAC